MGVYHRYRFNASFSSRPIYVHSARREFLFYVDGRARGLWMVGPEVGRFSGGLANRGDEQGCNSIHILNLGCEWLAARTSNQQLASGADNGSELGDTRCV